jgi:hypothetical protein
MKIPLYYEVTGSLWSYQQIMKLPTDYEVTNRLW